MAEEPRGVCVTFERQARCIPGYDHVNGPPCDECAKAKRRCDHGRCADIWGFIVIQEGVAAVELQLFTPYYPQGLPPTVDAYWSARAHFYHVAWPTSREGVIHGPDTESCSFLGDVPCYGQDAGLLIDADTKLVPLVDRTQTSPAPDSHPKLWQALEEDLGEAIERFKQLREAAGDLRWKKCPHCDDDGLIDLSKESPT